MARFELRKNGKTFGFTSRLRVVRRFVLNHGYVVIDGRNEVK